MSDIPAHDCYIGCPCKRVPQPPAVRRLIAANDGVVAKEKEDELYEIFRQGHRAQLEMVAHRLGMAHEGATDQSICHAMATCRAADHDPKLGAGRGFLQYVEALRKERDELLPLREAVKLLQSSLQYARAELAALTGEEK